MKKDFWLDEYLKLGTFIGIMTAISQNGPDKEPLKHIRNVLKEASDQYQKAIKEGDGHARFK